MHKDRPVSQTAMNEILTPTGFQPLLTCVPGDRVIGVDPITGCRVINHIKSIEAVDEKEWVRWHQNAQLPDFKSYRINDDFELFGEQSVYRNEGQVAHARHLRPGDIIFHNERKVRVKRIKEVDCSGWHRLEIDGNHSHIVDGILLHNASRFWVGGTGTWDLSDTTHWAASTGGAGGQTAPGSADAVTLDASSGGGTATPAYGGTGTFQSITCGAFTGTIAWNTNNENVTLSAIAGFICSGTGARTISLGNGIWTFTGTSFNTAIWNLSIVTNLTFNANSSILDFTGNITGAGGGGSMFTGGGLTYSTVRVSGQTGVTIFTMTGTNTFSVLTIAGRNRLILSSNQTVSTLNLNGSPSAVVLVASNSFGLLTRTLTVTTLNANWAAFSDIIMSGSGLVANNSFDLGNNSGFTINSPGNPINAPVTQFLTEEIYY